MPSKRLRLAERRKTVGLSQERLAAELGVERSTVARWEAGETEPQAWLRPKLARALDLSREDLGELLADGNDHPVGNASSTSLVGQPKDIDLLALAELRDLLRQLTSRYDQAPSASLIADAGQCLGGVTSLRRLARTSRSIMELHAIEAEAAILLGQLVWDASQRRDQVAARAYFVRAIDAAIQVADPSVHAQALLRLSFVALYGERDPTSALELTERAAYAAQSASPALVGLAHLHRAEALAMLGRRSNCEHALFEAEKAFARIGPSDVARGLFSPAQLGRLAGSCYLHMGKYARAQELLEDTARLLHDRRKSRAIVLGNLTLCHIRQADISGAVVALHEAIDVLEQTRGGGGLNVVFGAGRELGPWRGERIVREVQDRLMALMATG